MSKDVRFQSQLTFPLDVSASIDFEAPAGDKVNDFKVMLMVGSVSIDVTHAIAHQQRFQLFAEALNLAHGKTIMGGK